MTIFLLLTKWSRFLSGTSAAFYLGPTALKVMNKIISPEQQLTIISYVGKLDTDESKSLSPLLGGVDQLIDRPSKGPRAVQLY